MTEEPGNITRHTLHYQGYGAHLRANFCSPSDAGTHPGIVLLHDVHGPIDHVQRLAARLAGEGYAVLTPDLFSRGDGPGFPPRREVMSKMVDLPDTRITHDVDEAVAYLKILPHVAADRVAVMGFSLGARYAMFVCGQRPDIRAAVMFYGVLVYPRLTEFRPSQPLDSVSRFSCPALFFYGEGDTMVPMTNVDLLERLLKQQRKPYEMHRYPGVGHGFFNDQLKTFDSFASVDAWAKTLEFLSKNLEPQAPSKRPARP